MTDNLEDFEALLDSDFSAAHFSNDLLKATNGDPSTSELDLETSIKKINYDIREIETRITDVIKAYPTQLMDQMLKNKAAKGLTTSGLKPSVAYLDMSYERLQAEVLEPYERAQKLQNVLSKVHQTSILLRDGLVYVHLVNRTQSLQVPQQGLTIEKSLQLVSTHTQIRLSMEENPNLISLRLIKKLEADVVKPSRRELLNFLSTTLTKHAVVTNGDEVDNETIRKLTKSLHLLSKEDFVSTIHKIVLSSVAMSVQTLSKTLNSIKNFPTAFEAVVKKGQVIEGLEAILTEERVENATLLNDYMSQMRPRPLSPSELYWTRVAANFKKEFELSYTRGGPVGKSLSKNQTIISDTIKNDLVDNKYMDTMLRSISILNTDN